MESFWLLKRTSCTASEHSHTVRCKIHGSGCLSLLLCCVKSAVPEMSGVGVEVVLICGEEEGPELVIPDGAIRMAVALSRWSLWRLRGRSWG